VKPGSDPSAIVFSIIPFVILVAAIWLLDKKEKEPIRFLAIAIGFGALVAPLIAFGLDKLFDVPTSLTGTITTGDARQLSIGTPVIEEIVRGFAILAVFFLVRREVDDPLDGVVYGATVGAGFFLAAQFVSILSAQSFGAATATSSMFSDMVAGLNHVFYGAAIGLCIAGARRMKPAGLFVATLFGIGIAMGFHLAHDYFPTAVADPSTSSLAAFIANMPNFFGLLGLAVIVVWLLGREGVLIANELQDEVPAVVTRGDYLDLTRPGRRFGKLSRDFFTRQQVWRARRKLYGLETELAFRKYHRKTEGVQLKHYQEEDAYRAQIREARGALGTAVAEEAGGQPAPEPPPSTLWAGLGGISIVAILAVLGLLSYLFFFNTGTSGTSQEGTPGEVSAPLFSTASATGSSAFQTMSVRTVHGSSVRTASIQLMSANASRSGLPSALSNAPRPLAAGRPAIAVVPCRTSGGSGCGSNQPHTLAGIYIFTVIKNFPSGNKYGFFIYDPGHRKAVSKIFYCTSRGHPTEYCRIGIRGPFPRYTFALIPVVNGHAVNPVTRLTFT
jgi:RsiW-degrading membrane proteinase PrsW (M82 family)